MVHMETDDVMWLVPVETRSNQCLHIRLTRSDGVVNIVASEYQCLYGHRHSKLLVKKVSEARTGAEGGETCLIDIKEEQSQDMVAALKYMHSDSPDVRFDKHSVLKLARTADYMQITQLRQRILALATDLLSRVDEDSLVKICNIKQGGHQFTVWDAVAILHMLGDPNKAFPVDMNSWCISNPNVFADETLFSSCGHIFSAQCLASFIRRINQRYDDEISVICNSHSNTLVSYQRKLLGLTTDVASLLQSYVGKELVSVSCKRHGTVLRVDDYRKTELVVMWHHNASTTNIRIRELFNYSILE